MISPVSSLSAFSTAFNGSTVFYSISWASSLSSSPSSFLDNFFDTYFEGLSSTELTKLLSLASWAQASFSSCYYFSKELSFDWEVDFLLVIVDSKTLSRNCVFVLALTSGFFSSSFLSADSSPASSSSSFFFLTTFFGYFFLGADLVGSLCSMASMMAPPVSSSALSSWSTCNPE